MLSVGAKIRGGPRTIFLWTRSDQVENVPFILVLKIAEIETGLVFGFSILTPLGALIQHQTTETCIASRGATLVPETGSTLGYSFLISACSGIRRHIIEILVLIPDEGVSLGAARSHQRRV